MAKSIDENEETVDQGVNQEAPEVQSTEQAAEEPNIGDVDTTPTEPQGRDAVGQHDGTRLDQNVRASEFDHEAEEAAAHAETPEVSEAVKNAIQNPNGTGSEWPKG